MAEGIRIDKYLWAIRAFKTRSEATEACNGGKVKLNGVNAKPGKAPKPGDTIEIRKGPVCLSYRILQLTENRMGASLVPDFAENTTPESELAKFHAPVESLVLHRERGSGRPTKKERRELDSIIESFEID